MQWGLQFLSFSPGKLHGHGGASPEPHKHQHVCPKLSQCLVNASNTSCRWPEFPNFQQLLAITRPVRPHLIKSSQPERRKAACSAKAWTRNLTDWCSQDAGFGFAVLVLVLPSTIGYLPGNLTTAGTKGRASALALRVLAMGCSTDHQVPRKPAPAPVDLEKFQESGCANLPLGKVAPSRSTEQKTLLKRRASRTLRLRF